MQNSIIIYADLFEQILLVQ